MKTRPYDLCNKSIVVINVLVFLLLEIMGDTENGIFMYEHGAMFPEAVLMGGEGYRLFTCMFLHFGINHLVNNMLILYFLGDNLERAVGHIKFLIIYLLSGLCGSSLSMVLMVRNGDYAVSGGASGAIFGVIGALLYIVVRNRGRLEELTVKRMLFMAALSLYHGFVSAGVDNAAHVGGLVSGCLLSMLLYRKKRNKAVKMK